MGRVFHIRCSVSTWWLRFKVGFSETLYAPIVVALSDSHVLGFERTCGLFVPVGSDVPSRASVQGTRVLGTTHIRSTRRFIGVLPASRTNERTRFRVASGRTLSDPVIPFNGRIFFCDGAQRIHGLDLLPDQWVGRSRVNDEWA